MNMSATSSALAILLLVFSAGPIVKALIDDAPSGQTMAEPPFYKTSFDCKKAKILSTEAAICKSEELAKLDVEMASAYRKRLGSMDLPEKSQLVRSQEKWLVVRNSYSANPYHDDPIGALSDLADFYKSRIEALRSDQELLLDTKAPKEYEWLRALAPEGFSKGFSIGRTYMSCDDPCKKIPSSYRWISISGRGIGDEPGDIGTPFEKIVKKLLSEGWSKCRSTDDSGKPTMDYFVKNDKMVELFRYFSMGAGNSISFGITISPPLPENPPKPPPNPAVTVTRDWSTYSSSDEGLQFRYPPGWRIKGESAAGSGTKEVMIGAWDYTGNLTISVQP